MTAYYNEHDPFAAAWLRELIKAGHIASGVVDERSIEDVKPEELKQYTQCHFFAGIGVWSYALRQAGWPDDRPVWTGSCPCQPFSTAGKSAGFTDERHLWPHWFHLITQCEPHRIFGEQVASKDGLAWLDLVQADLEAANYANGAIDLCAAGVGAPHIRQRSWFVAERLANSSDSGFQGDEREGSARTQRAPCGHCSKCSRTGGVGDTGDPRSQGLRTQRELGESGSKKQDSRSSADSDPSPTNGFWREVDWLGCRDGKFRAVEPGTFPLANGPAVRVGRLRGYGNAINAEAAKEVIKSYMETEEHK